MEGIKFKTIRKIYFRLLRKVIIVTEINRLKRVRDIFMYNGEIRSWTEVWSFNRIFNMYESGQKFFKDFIKFNNYSWNENIVEYI
jgi:hypothetical protein